MATTLLRGGAESKGDAVGKVPVSAPRPLSTETNNYLVRQALSYPPLKRPKAAKKYLKHNCEECRKAQTKCDRTSPVCRRCNRLGIVCLSTPVKRGRPVKENTGELFSYLPLPYRSGTKTPKPAGQASAIQQRILRFKHDSLSKADKQTMRDVVISIIRWWTWMGYQRESFSLLSEAFKLCNAFEFSFDVFADILGNIGSVQQIVLDNKASAETEGKEAEKQGSNSSGSGGAAVGAQSKAKGADPWTEFLLADKGDDRVFVKRVPEWLLNSWTSDHGYKLTRCICYGRAHHFASGQMEAQFIRGSTANKIFFDNSKDVYACLFACGDEKRFFSALSQQQIDMVPSSLVLDKKVGEVKVFQRKFCLKGVRVMGKDGGVYRTDVVNTETLSLDGDYNVSQLLFVTPPEFVKTDPTKAGVTNHYTGQIREEKTAKDRGANIFIPDLSIHSARPSSSKKRPLDEVAVSGGQALPAKHRRVQRRPGKSNSDLLHFALAAPKPLSPPRPVRGSSRASSQGSVAESIGSSQDSSSAKPDTLYPDISFEGDFDIPLAQSRSHAIDITLGHDEMVDAEYLKSLFRGVRSESRTSLGGGSLSSFPGQSFSAGLGSSAAMSFGSFDRLFD